MRTGPGVTRIYRIPDIFTTETQRQPNVGLAMKTKIRREVLTTDCTDDTDSKITAETQRRADNRAEGSQYVSLG